MDYIAGIMGLYRGSNFQILPGVWVSPAKQPRFLKTDVNTSTMRDVFEPGAWLAVLIGRMEKKMETTIVLGLYWGYIGIMEKKMETTIKLMDSKAL